MKDFNFLPSIAIRRINEGMEPSTILKDMMLKETENSSSFKLDL